MTSQTNSSTPPTRRPYRGSCHCGHTKYIAYLTLPIEKPVIGAPSFRVRKCNCSTCHKMAFFHVRFLSAPNDFLLLSPLNPSTELSDYTCFDHTIHWYFCSKCGVRCFAFMGEGGVREVEVEGEGKVKAWTPKEDGWVEGNNPDKTGYLSVNAQTLDPGQEGLDLREWVQKKWVEYLNYRDDEGNSNFEKPHVDGTY